MSNQFFLLPMYFSILPLHPLTNVLLFWYFRILDTCWTFGDTLKAANQITTHRKISDYFILSNAIHALFLELSDKVTTTLDWIIARDIRTKINSSL